MHNKLPIILLSGVCAIIYPLVGMEQQVKRAKQAMTLHKSLFYDSTKLDEQLATGADVHETNKELSTPLHTFVVTRRNDCVVKLLLYGASIARANAVGNTPLHAAAHTTTDVAINLMVHPQGGPQTPTPELRSWQLSIALFTYALKKRNFPRDIRFKICKQMLPYPNKLIEWVPLRQLPYYASLCTESEKHTISELLVKRHLADVSYALNAKNFANQTPKQLAKTYMNQMRTEPVPVNSLNLNTLFAFKSIIRTRYAQLLGLKEEPA